MPLIAASVFHLVEHIASQVTVEDVWRAYLAAARRAGYMHGLAFFAATNDALAHRALSGDMPDGWLAAYTALRCELVDPLAARIKNATAPFAWKLSEWEHDPLPARRAWHALNHDAGLHAGVMIPHRMDGPLKSIALCGLDVPIDPHDRMALSFAGHEVLHRMQELGARPAIGMAQALSDRERECLRWVAAGKSDWEIGEILSISEKTVNVYVERAKHKLGVTNRVQAIVTALRFGLITL